MKIPKEFDRDLAKLLTFPTLSWSCISSWEYAIKYNKKHEWYKQYVLGERSPMNATMKAGVEIGHKLVADKNFLPEVPRPKIYEYSLKGRIGNIYLLGHMDGWTPIKKELLEFKTSENENRWTQDVVDTWGQIDMYCLLLYVNHNIKPEDLTIKLVAIPTENNGDFVTRVSKTKKIKIFKTKRTLIQIVNFMVKIKAIHKDMSEFVASYQQSNLQ